MKTIFHGYYQPTDQEFDELWQNGFFVLDANVLLNLYRYSPEVRKDFLNIFAQISDRLWLPHQVALEYQENRLEVIAQQKNMYIDTLKILHQTSDDFSKLRKNLVDLGLLHKTPSDFVLAGLLGNALADFEYLCKKFEDTSPELENVLKQKQAQAPDLSRQDDIRDILTTHLSGKVGPPYSPKRLLEIYEIGEKRYKSKIPPGYRDNNKEGEMRYGNLTIKEKFGDLISWYQIIDRAKETQKPIIFVTDEKKEDWWWKAKDDKTIGPRPELITEMKAEANVSFYMYNSERFIERVQHYFKVEVTRGILDEIRKITGQRIRGSGPDMSGLDLSGRDFSGQNLSYYNFSHADLSGAKLIEADLSHTDLGDTNLSRANLSGADLSYAEGLGTDFCYADLSGADLRGAAFDGYMTGVNLKRANLSKATLEACDMDEANLRGANLNEADLRDAYLVGADLRETDLSHTNLNGAMYDDSTKWPDGFDPTQAGAVNVTEKE